MRTIGHRKEHPITFSASAALLAEGARFNDEIHRLPKAAEEMKAAGLKSVGISSIFSPLDPSHERRAAELDDDHEARAFFFGLAFFAGALAFGFFSGLGLGEQPSFHVRLKL